MIVGHCNRCGDCCKVGISVGLMKDHKDDYCRHLRWDNGSPNERRLGLAVCPFREGQTEPKEAYDYWLRACVPFPRNLGDLRSVPRCSYRWVTDG